MTRRPPSATLTAPLFPYTPLCRSPGTGRHAQSRKDAGRPSTDRERVDASENGAYLRVLDATVRDGVKAGRPVDVVVAATLRAGGQASGAMRSEEHTSELQSLMRNSYAVFCLKKKQHTYKQAK